MCSSPAPTEYGRSGPRVPCSALAEGRPRHAVVHRADLGGTAGVGRVGTRLGSGQGSVSTGKQRPAPTGLHRVWGLGHPSRDQLPREDAPPSLTTPPDAIPHPPKGRFVAHARAPAAAPQTRAEPVSAPHEVPHLITSEPDTRSSVVRPPAHARADDALVPTGTGGRPRAPPLPRRRRVFYAPPPRDRAMLRCGPPPCYARAARRGRIGLRSLGHFGASVRERPLEPIFTEARHPVGVSPHNAPRKIWTGTVAVFLLQESQGA